MKKIVLTFPVLILLGAGGRASAQPPPPVRLTLKEAEELALKNHPQVLEAQAFSAEASQLVTEARSAYLPLLNGEVTSSVANRQARIGAGFLSTSSLFNRFGQGIELSQLITDSGRTPNLVAGSRLHAQASRQVYRATRYDVLLGVNRAYYDALQAQALVKVAEQTVAARQLLVDQVTALAKNKLRSQLDVSFAEVNLSEAKLLLIRSEDSVKQTFAQLMRALGTEQLATYTLVEEPLPPSLPADAEQFVTEAMKGRPEVLGLSFERDSAYRFEQAEKDLSYPSVSLVGVAGALPLISQETAPRMIPNEYAGAAVNVQIPIFNGHLFSARREAARQRALAADQRLRDLQQSIARDVRAAWASSMTAYQRLDVTAQFLRQAALAVNLAQGRYDLGLGSIVELTQAQLNVTQAEIENLGAKYDYQAQYAALQYAIGLLR